MLRCPNCGAPARPGDVACGYCRVQLKTVACASCLGSIFVGDKHCAHCGARVFATRAAEPASDGAPCPRCRAPLTTSALGSAILDECGRCGGVWVDARSFEALCTSTEAQAAYVGAGSPLAPPGRAATTGEVRYVPCPTCGATMNRMNFARVSGVIVDVCKQHGTWFDHDELGQVIEFIRQGGLDAARAKERQKLALERERQKERERGPSIPSLPLDGDGGLLDWFLRGD